jgi:hypothetical protein
MKRCEFAAYITGDQDDLQQGGLPAGMNDRLKTKKTYQKLSEKLRGQGLSGVESAEKYLFHQYRRNRPISPIKNQ